VSSKKAFTGYYRTWPILVVVRKGGLKERASQKKKGRRFFAEAFGQGDQGLGLMSNL